MQRHAVAFTEIPVRIFQITVSLGRLREELLPRTVLLLLHSLLHNTGQYNKCLHLADLVASDQHHIYQVYTKTGLRELLAKLRESSLAVMEEGGTDSWGYAKL